MAALSNLTAHSGLHNVDWWRRVTHVAKEGRRCVVVGEAEPCLNKSKGTNRSTLCRFPGHVNICLPPFLLCVNNLKVAAFVLRCTGETGPPLLGRRTQNGSGRGHGRGQDQRSGGSCQNHSVWGRNSLTDSLTPLVTVMQHWHLMSPLCHCPKELDHRQEPDSLPVAQMKARRIIESFENPFRMVGVDSVRVVHVPASSSRHSAFSISLPVFTLHRRARQQELQVWPVFQNIWGDAVKHVERLLAGRGGGACSPLTEFFSWNPPSPLCRSAKGGNCWV